MAQTEGCIGSEAISRLRKVGMTLKDQPQHKTLARASVLVPLFWRGNSLHVLLTKRPENMRTHAGEVCFPGGRQDPDDENDDVETALREAREEVGLDPSLVTPICRLETLEFCTGLCVTPIVGIVHPAEALDPASLKVSKDEVEAAFSVPLSYFADETNLSSKHDVEWRDRTVAIRTYHYTSVCGRTFKIWGLTAHIAHRVAAIAIEFKASGIHPESTFGGVTIRLGGQQTPLSGYLFRLEDVGGAKPYWVRRYFAMVGQILHQFEGKRQAARKDTSASESNRLHLVDNDVCLVPTSKTGNYQFAVRALSGRVLWYLAAQSNEERDRWVQGLVKRLWTTKLVRPTPHARFEQVMEAHRNVLPARSICSENSTASTRHFEPEAHSTAQ